MQNCNRISVADLIIDEVKSDSYSRSEEFLIEKCLKVTNLDDIKFKSIMGSYSYMDEEVLTKTEVDTNGINRSILLTQNKNNFQGLKLSIEGNFYLTFCSPELVDIYDTIGENKAQLSRKDKPSSISLGVIQKSGIVELYKTCNYKFEFSSFYGKNNKELIIDTSRGVVYSNDRIIIYDESLILYNYKIAILSTESFKIKYFKYVDLQGIIYFKPIQLEVNKIKLFAKYQGRIEFEYFDHNISSWKTLNNNVTTNISKNKEFKLRLKTDYYSKVYSIALQTE